MVKEFTHVLYHGNCYDGFGSAFAAWKKLGSKGIEYIPCIYGAPVVELPSDARVLMCDFSYPREELLALHAKVELLVVLDHHKTAEAALEGLGFAHFDMERSGATMTWEYFHGPERNLFMDYLEDRDLWRFALPGSKGVSQALRAYPFDFEVWDGLTVEQLLAEGPVIERFTAQMVALMCDHVVWRWLGFHLVPVANATVFFSEVGDELCRRHPEAPFAGYYMDRGDGLRQWGLRSRGGFDVSEVAKEYGGGGHAAASGWTEEVPD